MCKRQLKTVLVLLSFPFWSISQSVTDVVPNSGNEGTTLDITISGAGTNFTQATNTAISFYFHAGTSTATHPNDYTVIDDETISANITIPSGTYQGYYGITIYNDVDGCMANPDFFLVNGPPAPEITLVTPGTGIAGNTYPVQITAVNTAFTQSTSTAVYFLFSQATNTITIADNVTVLDDENLSAEISIPDEVYQGSYDVVVYSDNHGYIWYRQGFTVDGTNGPQVVDITPETGVAGETYTITVTGINTTFTQGSNGSTFFVPASNTCLLGGLYDRSLPTFTFLPGGGNEFLSTISPNYINVISDEVMEINFTLPLDIPVGPIKFDLYNSEQGYIYNPFDFTVLGYAELSQIEKSQFKVYPNPFEDELYLEINSETSKYVDIELFSLSGRLVLSQRNEVQSERQKIVIPPVVSPGVYALKLTTDSGETVFKKVIKQ